MDSILQPPQRDEYGLPILPSGQANTRANVPEVTSDNWQDIMASLGLPKETSLEEIRKEARVKSVNLISNWKELRGILERHEETIRKRWLKKTKTQRKKILLAAWPNMAPSHRPDYAAFRKGASQSDTLNTSSREAYIWPYINQEDLSSGRNMLLMLNSRGRNNPELFGHSDIAAVKLGLVSRM